MSKKLIIILAAVGVLVLGMMGAGFLVIWNKMAEMKPAAAAVVAAEGGQEAKQPQTVGITYPLDTFVVNLADKGGNRYLRVTLALEFGDEALKETIDKRLPRVRDTLLTILPSKSTDQIVTAEGKIALREEIIEQLNAFLGDGKITNIYYTEFVIQ